MADFADICEAVVARWAQSSAITLYVGDRAFGLAAPAKVKRPFIKMGVPTISPDFQGCEDAAPAGAIHSAAVHTFTAEPSGIEATKIMAAVVKDMDGAVLLMPDGAKVHVTWKSTQVVSEGNEAESWHGFAFFDFHAA